MRYNYTVTRVWDIPIRVNISLLVFLPVLTWLLASGGQLEAYAGAIEALSGVPVALDTLRAGATPWVVGIVASVALFVGVTLHELGHSWVALRYGIEIDSITLWILGGLASLRSIPRDGRREFWIAVAGPIVSFALGGLAWGVLLVLPESATVTRFLVGWVAITNLTLAVFNLLPAFPMDGGRILRAYLSRTRPYARATRLASRVGVAFAVLFLLVGVVTGQLTLLLLAVFIYTAATSESRAVVVGELLDGYTAGDVATRDVPTLSADTTVAEFGGHVVRHRRTAYPVTDGNRVVGIVSLSALRDVSPDDHPTTTIGDLVHDPIRVEADTPAFDCLTELGRDDAALVVERGTVVGVLTQNDFAELLALLRGTGPGPRVAA